ncbi:MAG: SufS family cysteine desulfurase [bacterium]|nr:SufS family cysteine desulfurase [bacterium]
MPNNFKPDFPIFKRRVNGKPLVYLDSAATSQKPLVVINALSNFYTTMNANIHRGIHTLSEEATAAYEETREKVAKFIGAKPEEIVFTKNGTESLNCVAVSWGANHIQAGDEIIVSALEHHANLVPWQELARTKKASLKIIPLTADYTLDQSAYAKLLNKKTKLVCLTAQSNVTGTIVPVKTMTAAAHAVGAKVVVDGAQRVGHAPVSVRDIKCDWLTFSAHKMLGPTGVGVLYVRAGLMDEMIPFMYGGDMVESVQDYSATYRSGPAKFEAGTPSVADVVAFGAAIDYLNKVGLNNIARHDAELLAYAKAKFAKYKQVKIFSPARSKDCSSVLSFTIDGVHPHDIATIFDAEGVAIRSGLHCAEPLVRRLGVATTARMSFYLYNTKADIDTAEKALLKIFSIFKIKN